MKILVLEDERPNFLRLQKQLQSLSADYETVGPAETVASAVTYLSEAVYDLIIADVRLADGLVFDAFDGCRVSCAVIFTTAYNEYAIRAFDYNGICYLLKPIVTEELAAALRKAVDMRAGCMREDLDRLHSLVAGGNLQYRRRFLVSDKDGYFVVGSDAVSHIVSDDGVTRLYLKDRRTFAVDQSLDTLERQLDPAAFFRANRRHIVHIASVERLNTWFNRKMKVVIAGYPDAEIIVSKEKTTALKRWLDF